MRKVRVYQRDRADQIRIGASYFISDIDKAVEGVKEGYADRFGGTFDDFIEKYGYAIAIVDAETLAPVKVISGEF